MKKHSRPKILCVDFDKTLAHPVQFPYIMRATFMNKVIWRYVRFMKRRGYTITLNTMREHGKGLQVAIDFCEEHNIPIDRVNENLPEEIAIWGESRKIACKYSIDDTQVGLIGWLLRRFG